MVVSICDSSQCCVARVYLDQEGVPRIEGDLPGGLTPEDLKELGFVYYETSPKGDLVARVQEVAPEESLAYLRALLDSLPPGYHISQVESERIEQEREQKRELFERELSLMNEED